MRAASLRSRCWRLARRLPQCNRRLPTASSSSTAPKCRALRPTWDALLDWGGWWPAAHSYSGSAANLEINAQPAGRLEETWTGGSVLHGTVVAGDNGPAAALNAAALGPLQAMPVNAILDIALAPSPAGTRSP
jgi:hypothetical protein